MSASWIPRSNNVRNPQLRIDIEKAIHTGLNPRETADVRITEAENTFIVSVVVAGNEWTSDSLPIDERALSRLEFDIIRPLQRWAKAGFPEPRL